MPHTPNGLAPGDDGALFGNRLVFFVLCLYLPEFALLSAFAGLEKAITLGFWIPFFLPGTAIAGLAHVARSSEWPNAVCAAAMFVALYWLARGIASVVPKRRHFLTTVYGALLALYSVWSWWAANVALAP